MMSNSNSDYWRRRAEMLEEEMNKNAGELTLEIEQSFNLAQKEIDEQIEQWYGRFATNNQISLTEARQWLTGKDLAEFKWDVDTYIQNGHQLGLNPEFIKQLENASTRFHISKLEALKIKTQNTLETLYGKTSQQTSDLFKQIYQENYYHTLFDVQSGFNIGWDISALNPHQLEAVLSKPWTLDNLTFSDRIWSQKDALLSEVHTRLTQNMILGKSPDAAISAISKKFNTSKHNAGRLVMTESAYFASEAQKSAYRTLGVDEFEIVVTLDETTCDICGAFDGEHYPMSQYEAGVSVPPFHPWCRCTTAPYFADNTGERFARDHEGKAVNVPADMKYDEWKDKFITSQQQTPPSSTPPVVTIGNKSVTINMGSLEQAFGKEHTEKLREIIENAPPEIQQVWNEYADRLTVENAHWKGTAHCRGTRGISIDIDKDALGRKDFKTGLLDKQPYYVTFHEFGHNVSAHMAKDLQDFRDIADVFQSKAFTHPNGTGFTLTEMLIKEGNDRIDSIWNRLKDEAVANGLARSSVGKYTARSTLLSELRSKPVSSMTDVSDIFDGITKSAVRAHYGHGASYWKTHTVGTEAFAEMFSATMMNPNSLAEIQYYFPDSYKIFEEIINSVGVP